MNTLNAVKNLITYKKGPQFRNGNAVIPFMLTWILLFVSVYSVIENYSSNLLFSLPLMVVMINFTFDRQGVEIDKAKGLVRLYRLDLFIKYGKWRNLNEYYEISLDHKNYTVNHHSFHSTSNSLIAESHGHFLISLVHTDSTKTLILAVGNNYWDSVDRALSIAAEIGLPLNDVFDTRLKNSRSRRRR